MKKAVLLVPVLFLLACQAVLLTTPSQSDIERVAEKYPNYTLVELQEGKKQYEKHCQTCHGLKNPRKESEEEWKEIVPEMVHKAKKKRNIVIDIAAEEVILKYVITMSSAPKPIKSK